MSTSDDVSVLALRAQVRELSKALATSVLGVEFLADPEGFVVAAMIKWVLEQVVLATGVLAVQINAMIDLTTNVVVTSLSSAFGPLGRDLALLVVGPRGVFAMLDGLFTSFAKGLGPAGPIVILVLWLAVAYVVIVVVQWVAKALYEVITTVIP